MTSQTTGDPQSSVNSSVVDEGTVETQDATVLKCGDETEACVLVPVSNGHECLDRLDVSAFSELHVVPASCTRGPISPTPSPAFCRISRSVPVLFDVQRRRRTLVTETVPCDYFVDDGYDDVTGLPTCREETTPSPTEFIPSSDVATISVVLADEPVYVEDGDGIGADTGSWLLRQNASRRKGISFDPMSGGDPTKSCSWHNYSLNNPLRSQSHMSVDLGEMSYFGAIDADIFPDLVVNGAVVRDMDRIGFELAGIYGEVTDIGSRVIALQALRGGNAASITYCLGAADAVAAEDTDPNSEACRVLPTALLGQSQSPDEFNHGGDNFYYSSLSRDASIDDSDADVSSQYLGSDYAWDDDFDGSVSPRPPSSLPSADVVAPQACHGQADLRAIATLPMPAAVPQGDSSSGRTSNVSIRLGGGTLRRTIDFDPPQISMNQNCVDECRRVSASYESARWCSLYDVNSRMSGQFLIQNLQSMTTE